MSLRGDHRVRRMKREERDKSRTPRAREKSIERRKQRRLKGSDR